jgi:hypothetical protein
LKKISSGLKNQLSTNSFLIPSNSLKTLEEAHREDNRSRLSLISLHCGHNGWPHQDDLATLTSFISAQGFKLNDGATGVRG